MKKIDYAISIDKLRVCLNMPDKLYDYLKDHYTRHDENNNRILDEDDFSLVFIEEEEQKMVAVVNVRDVEGYYRLGTFTFHNGAKYEGKAFFSFENAALYRIYMRQYNGEPTNHICDLQYICEFYGISFNNVTELELAMDTNYNYIGKVRRMIKDVEHYDLILNGQRVVNDETLDGNRYAPQLNRLPFRKTLVRSPTNPHMQGEEQPLSYRNLL